MKEGEEGNQEIWKIRGIHPYGYIRTNFVSLLSVV